MTQNSSAEDRGDTVRITLRAIHGEPTLLLQFGYVRKLTNRELHQQVPVPVGLNVLTAETSHVWFGS